LIALTIRTDLSSSQTPILGIGELFLVILQQRLKRFMDILVSLSALIVLSPVLLLAALIVLVTDGLPVFYISKRFIGLNKSIRVYKFRSMVKDAKSPKYRLNERFMRNGYLDIPLTCEVFTPFGRILERTQLVEVPQFVNILFDGMALIGNRPLPGNNIELLKSHVGWEDRFESPAGITGIAQVVGKLNMGPDQRLALEVLYSKVYKQGNIVKCDLYIIWFTIRLILLNKALDYKYAKNFLASCLKSQ